MSRSALYNLTVLLVAAFVSELGLMGAPVDKRSKGKAGAPGQGAAVRQSSMSPQLEEQTEVAALLPFAKMQALGNDFVVVDENDLVAIGKAFDLFDDWQKIAGSLAKALCNRHYGIGADGLIVARAAKHPDCKLGWRYINSDGSDSRMCGNGLRCLALWAVERQWAEPVDFAIETEIGPVAVNFNGQDFITIDLGEPILDSTLIPVSGMQRHQVVRQNLTVAGKVITATCVSMGNPHCVIFEPNFPQQEYGWLAAAIQSMPEFPEGVNVEFAHVESKQLVRVFVWERGCGATLACASGAAATLVAGVLEERISRSARIELPGGALFVEWKAGDGRVRLTGPARESFVGRVDLAQFQIEESDR